MIRELYTRDKDPNCYHPGDPSCTGIKPGRPATAILVASSFIWPHVKLLLLHIMFYRTLKPVNRRNRNYWLAFFGKWTLTDVLVWCACIGVFHGLSVNDSIPSLWSKVEDDALHLCASLCANKTHVSNSTCDVLCHDLTNMLDRTVLSPSELPTSNVDVHLAFRTRIGTPFALRSCSRCLLACSSTHWRISCRTPRERSSFLRRPAACIYSSRSSRSRAAARSIPRCSIPSQPQPPRPTTIHNNSRLSNLLQAGDDDDRVA